MSKINYREFIENHIKDMDISYRGGTLKIDVSELFPNLDEPAIMGASQNYLGGGIAGAITSGSMFNTAELTKKEYKVYQELAEECKKYFYDLNNGGGDEYMQEEVTGASAGGYKKNQSLPVSGY